MSKEANAPTLVKVGEIAAQIRGVTYTKQEAENFLREGYVPILRAMNITEHGLTYDDLVYVPIANVSERQMLQVGDIVVAASSGSLDIVGKASVVVTPVTASFGAFCKVVRPGKNVYPSYLGHFFRTPEYRSIISRLAQGANINNLKNEHIDDLEIPLPPLDEQKRIAAVLDKADALRRQRQESLQLTEKLLQSVFIDMFGDPMTNPKDLPTKTLGEVMKVTSGNSLPGKDMSPGGTFPVFGGNGISGYHDKFIFEEARIVIGRVGAYCGSIHISPPKSWVTDNALYVDRLFIDIDQIYLAHALRYAKLNQYAGRAAQPLVSGGRIYPVRILIPSRENQIRFRLAVESHDKLTNYLTQHSRSSSAFFSSLQQRAFRGELDLSRLQLDAKNSADAIA